MAIKQRFPFALTSIAAFLLPALALWVRSGYSYAAVLLLIGGVFFLPWWIGSVRDRKTIVLALIFLAMGCMWFILSLDTGAGRWDKGSKWILGAFCLLFVAQYGPRIDMFVAGLPIGCLGMGLTALWQIFVQGVSRANGYTNAIQWGNTGMLLACLSAACLVVYWHRKAWWWRMLMLLAILAALTASLFSESRGGWVAPVVAAPFTLIWTRKIAPDKLKLAFVVLAVFVAVFAAGFAATPQFRDRVAVGVSEVQRYYSAEEGDTSLGVRLQQYRLAADMIAEKPWLGWGAHGFVGELENRVNAGEYSPLMVNFPQIHNDLLDVWVKAGLLGCLLQLALYGWVLYMFWPNPRRLKGFERPTERWCDALVVRIMGCLAPICFLVFGSTQPFFNHNSGIMTYVFYVAVLWAALRRMEREASDDNGNPDKALWRHDAMA